MKQKMKKVLSLVLSAVLVVTGLTITPPATADVSAAMRTQITSSKDSNSSEKPVYYWQGESFELYFTADEQNLTIGDGISVTNDEADAQDQFESLQVTSTDSTMYANAKEYKISAKLNADAKTGDYIFTVGTYDTDKKITVYEKDCFRPSPVYKNGIFYNNPEKPFTETFVYSNVAREMHKADADYKDVKFEFKDEAGNSVSQYIDVKVSTADLSKNKGCATYDVTITPTKMLDEAGNPMIETGGKTLKLYATYKDHNGQVQSDVYTYTILQCATKISEPKLIDQSKLETAQYYGMDKEEFIANYPHYKDGNIYIDSNETIYLSMRVENGLNDDCGNVTVSNTVNNEWESAFDYGDIGNNGETDQYNFTKKSGLIYVNEEGNEHYILKLTAKDNVSTAGRASNLQITFTSDSSSVSATYNVFVYNTSIKGNRKPSLELSEGDNKWSEAEGVALVYNPYNQSGQYEFRMKNVDKNEQIIFSTEKTVDASFIGGKTTGTATNNDLLYPQQTPAKMVLKSKGSTGVVTAQTEATLTRPRGAYGVVLPSMTINELVLPEPGMFKILKDTKEILNDSIEVKSSINYGLYKYGKTNGGKGEEVVSNYNDCVWESSDKSVATVDNSGKVTAHKQGTTRITVRTNYGSSYGRNDLITEPVILNVYSPITNLSITNGDGETCKEKIVAGREYIFKADKKASDNSQSTQQVEWKLVNTTNAEIIKDEEGNAATDTEWVVGDSCKVRVKPLAVSENAIITLQCRPADVSSGEKTVTMTVVPEIKANNLYIDYTDNTSLRSNVGSESKLKAVQYADEAKTIVSNEKLIWTSSAPDKVEVNANEDGSSAKLIFVSLGEAVITVKNEAGTLLDTVNVATIQKATAVAIACSDKNNIVTSAEPVTLTATLTPTSATDPIRWESNLEDVVVFEEVSNGVVKVIADSNAEAGTKVVITATAVDSNVSKTFNLTVKKSAKDFVVTGMPSSYEYTGVAILPHKMDGFAVTCNDVILTENVDYNVAIVTGTNTNAGVGKLKITGKGNYTGTKEIDFIIAPKSIAEATVKINNDKNFTYTGTAIAITPGRNIAVSLPMGTLTKNLTANDYDVICVNNVNAGTATVTIAGKGNFTGTITKTFVIEPKDLSRTPVTLEATSFEYTGSAICPNATVKDGTKVLTAGVDYTVTYSDNVNVNSPTTAKPTATITGIGNYTGTKVANFSITAQTLTVESVTLSKTDYNYSGKNCKPKVTVRNSAGKKLKANVDYTVTYPTDMASIGIKKIVVTGKGNYKGIVNAEYGVAEKVSVKKASIKKVKNSKAKTVTFEVKKVSGAAGYEISYSTSKKFTKETTKVVTSKKTKKTIKKLQKGKTYYFKVRAYKVNSIGRKIYGKASAVKKVKIKK